MSERSEQAAIFEWAEYLKIKYPELRLYAIPNGQVRPGVPLEPGVQSGYPDIGLDVARRGYHGLRIELKVGRNKLTAAQQGWSDYHKMQGYYTAACWGFDQAVDCILWYLGDDRKEKTWS